MPGSAEEVPLATYHGGGAHPVSVVQVVITPELVVRASTAPPTDG